MRKLTKLLVLVLSMALLVGSIFAVASFAAEEDTGLTIEGAARTHVDFTDVQFEKHLKVNADAADTISASPTTQTGTAPIVDGVKYGHVRTVKTPDGNTWYEWLFEEDNVPTSAKGVQDSMLSPISGEIINSYSYYVLEYDMSTRTRIPGNMSIFQEVRAYAGSTEDKGYRVRPTLATYSTADGKWTAGDNTFTTDANEWVHITVVYKVVATTETVDGVDKVNYKNSVANLYVDGQFMNSINFMPDYLLDPSTSVKIHYAGLGYPYGIYHTGTLADDGVVIDNVVRTTLPNTYAADVANDKLAPLFAAENPTTNVKDLCEAIVYTEGYALPETELGVASFLTEDGDEFVAANIEQAIALMKEYEAPGSTIKLYANRYNPVHIDYPCVIDLNGYTLQNDYTCSSDLVVTMDAEEGTLTFAHDPENSATFQIYNVAYENIGTTAPLKTQVVALGNPVDASVVPLETLGVVVDGKTGIGPDGTVKIYDADGAEVDITKVEAANCGKTYYVCPVIKTVTMEKDIVFYTRLNNAVTFYDTTDLWAAGVTPAPVTSEVTTTEADGVVTKTWTVTQEPKCIPDGMLIVLVKDATAPTDLMAANGGTFTIDLAGHKLNAPTQLISTYAIRVDTTYTQVGDAEATSTSANNVKNWYKNSKVFVYSSAAGAEIVAGGNLIYGKNSESSSQANNVALYFGYQNAETVSEHRITVNFGSQILAQEKGAIKNLYLANLDLYNGKAHATGLISAQQSRGLNVYFTDCNLYTQSPLFGSNANSGRKSITFTNTNVYAEGGIAMNWLLPNAAGDGSYVDGTTSLTMTNSKVYGMTFGQTAGDGLSEYTAEFVITMDASSFISDAHANITLPEGKALVKNPSSVTIGDTTYTTIYAVGTGTEPTAKFDVYDVPFAQFTGEQTPVYSWDIVENGWFAHYATPAGETTYDYANDPYNTITPRGYEVYDEEGNLVTGPAVAGKTYRVFVKLEKVAVSFVIIDKDGNVTPYFEPTLLGVTFADGDTLILMSHDVALVNAITTSISIDLNGKTLYQTAKTNTFQPGANVKQFIYSSKEGGKFIQGYTTAGSCGYLVNMNSAGAQFYFGYKDAETKSPYRIELYVGALGEVKKENCHVYLAQADVYKCFGDNYGFLNFRNPGYTNSSYNVEDCNFYGDISLVVIREITTGIGTVNLKNCNLYTTGGYFVGYQKTNVGEKLVINVENVAIYGTMVQGALPAGIGCEINVKGYFYTPFEPTFVKLNGQVVTEEAHSATYEGKLTPNAGYGNAGKVQYAGTYNSAYAVVADTFDVNAYKAQAFQNMTLDTNVVGNLYIPVDEAVASVMLGGDNILDKTAIRRIGGKDYYVLTFGVAPKYGNRSLTLIVNLERGVAVEFPMSVENYAKALFDLDGTTNEYVADSQRMMKYVLTYIKEVAVAFGGADAATVFADMDIAVDTNVALKETVKDTTAINTYITHAALDLDAYAGFAFKVAVGFVGTVRVEMAGVDTVEKTYTAETPAGATEVLVLENVPAYLFRSDVTITVTPAEGEAVVAQFNLATYASGNADAYIKALYAYTVEAEAYNTKYPTVNTVN